MMLADGGIFFVWIGGVLLIGFVGFFAVLLTMVARFFSFLLRGGRSLVNGTPRLDPPAPAGQRACPNRRCGHTNRRDARYCARCGMQMTP